MAMEKQAIQEAMAVQDGLIPAQHYDGYRDANYNVIGERPDYFTDNEIDRMVRDLKDDEELNAKYSKCLRDVCNRDNTYWTHLALPAQKVEAYLKAVGKWAEESAERRLHQLEEEADEKEDAKPVLVHQEGSYDFQKAKEEMHDREDLGIGEAEDREFSDLSNCCTAPIVMHDICSRCCEHCSIITEDEDNDEA
jgi:hypothetical protein